MAYREKDKVILISVPNDHWKKEGIDDKWLGAKVQISALNDIRFTWSGGPVLAFDCIERYADPKIEEKRRKEEEKKAAELAEKLKNMVYKASDVYELAKNIFGEERVDLQHKSNEFVYSIVVHFPNIEISNINDHRHIIRDLYVRFRVELNKADIERGDGWNGTISLEGKRGTFSLKEYESGYLHSHLRSGSWDYSSFCLGSSAYTILLQTLALELTEDMWMGAFLSLENYVKWESLEGGPYIRLSQLKYSSQKSINVLKEELRKIAHNIPEQCWEVNNGVRIIEGHPDLYRYFDKTSSIKSLNSYNKEEAMRRTEEGMKRLSPITVLWKENKLPIMIHCDDIEEVNVKISHEVVCEYSNIIKTEGKNYLKIYQHESRKARYKEGVFGKI